MGQPIEVTSQAGGVPAIRIFSINRSLSGMKIEEYRGPAEATGERWVDEMARRLGALGATRVTVYASSIIAEAPDWSGLTGPAEEAIAELYTYYVDGKIPEGDYTGEEPEPAEVAEPAEAAEAETSA
ncbi:MAG: hypothetical protein HYU28_04450 [Actinobacteria bacterium]|nr:hypothetical protein [Actinomycetota bacterium]